MRIFKYRQYIILLLQTHNMKKKQRQDKSNMKIVRKKREKKHSYFCVKQVAYCQQIHFSENIFLFQPEYGCFMTVGVQFLFVLCTNIEFSRKLHMNTKLCCFSSSSDVLSAYFTSIACLFPDKCADFVWSDRKWFIFHPDDYELQAQTK